MGSNFIQAWLTEVAVGATSAGLHIETEDGTIYEQGCSTPGLRSFGIDPEPIVGEGWRPLPRIAVSLRVVDGRPVEIRPVTLN